jgi:hypothetical protein
LRTEPPAEHKSRGQLEVFYDLVPGSNAMAHRLAALPCRIPLEMAPVVEAIPRHRRVRTLVDEAPALVPDIASAAEVRRSTLDIVRLAAMKGFLRLSPAQTSSS